MNRTALSIAVWAGILSVFEFSRVTAQPRTITPDLAALASARKLTLVNRAAAPLVDGERKGVRLTERPGEGIAFLPEIEFSSGTIELDIRGKDLAQQSFGGVAFHGNDATTYDAIYFRPFNFRVPDPVSRTHAVQYHSLPLYTWQKLRAEQPGKYEQSVNPVPDPNAWFHVRVVIANGKASVFAGGSAVPSLSVNLLGDRKNGLIGLWVGNNSGGDFANLAVTFMP